MSSAHTRDQLFVKSNRSQNDETVIGLLNTDNIHNYFKHVLDAAFEENGKSTSANNSTKQTKIRPSIKRTTISRTFTKDPIKCLRSKQKAYATLSRKTTITTTQTDEIISTSALREALNDVEWEWEEYIAACERNNLGGSSDGYELFDES